MTKSRTIILLAILFYCVGVSELKAQQLPIFNQYFLNPYLNNPAFAGANDDTRAFLIYRRQWADIDGAPETQGFTLESRLKNTNLGLGLSLFNDITNILGRTGGFLSSSVDVNLSPNQKLKFGISLGFQQNRIYFDRIRADDGSDEAFLRDLDNRTTFDGNVGIAYSFKSLQLGAAVDQVFENRLKFQNSGDFNEIEFQLVRHYFLTAQYEFKLANKWALTPLVASRIAQGLRSQTDFNLKIQYDDLIWLNPAYREGFGFALSLGFNIEDTYSIGYSYEVPVQNALSVFGGNSHEITLGIKFKRKGKKGKSSKDAKIENQQLQKIDQKVNQQYEKLDQLSQDNETLKRDLKKSQETIDRQAAEIKKLQEVRLNYQQELAKEKQVSEVQPDEEVEKDASYYLVVGAFKDFSNAKKFQGIYTRKSGLKTKLVQSNTGTWYFIYTEGLSDLENIQKKVDQVANNGAKSLLVGKPWIFKKKSSEK